MPRKFLIRFPSRRSIISVARVATSRIVQDVVLEALIQSVRVGVAAVVVAGVITNASSTIDDAAKRRWWNEVLDHEWEGIKRIYGSRGRVCWVAFLGCLVAGSAGIDNLNELDDGRIGTIRAGCTTLLHQCLKDIDPVSQ